MNSYSFHVRCAQFPPSSRHISLKRRSPSCARLLAFVNTPFYYTLWRRPEQWPRTKCWWEHLTFAGFTLRFLPQLGASQPRPHEFRIVYRLMVMYLQILCYLILVSNSLEKCPTSLDDGPYWPKKAPCGGSRRERAYKGPSVQYLAELFRSDQSLRKPHESNAREYWKHCLYFSLYLHTKHKQQLSHQPLLILLPPSL